MASPTRGVEPTSGVLQTPEPERRTPWGVVHDHDGIPIAEARVRLQVYDEEVGEFRTVPIGSAIMSEETRGYGFTFTNTFGEFSWGVLPGTYRVAAQAPPFCTSMVDQSNVTFSEERTVPPGARNLLIQFDCTRRNFGSLEVELFVFDGTATLSVDVSCVAEGQSVFEGVLPLSPQRPLEVSDLPVDAVCDLEVIDVPDNFKLMSDRTFEVNIDPQSGADLVLTGFANPAPDDFLVALFASPDIGDVGQIVDFTVSCDGGHHESFSLGVDETYTVDGVTTGDLCSVTVDDPSRYTMDTTIRSTVVTHLPLAVGSPYGADDMGFEIRGLP